MHLIHLKELHWTKNKKKRNLFHVHILFELFYMFLHIIETTSNKRTERTERIERIERYAAAAGNIREHVQHMGL